MKKGEEGSDKSGPRVESLQAEPTPGNGDGGNIAGNSATNPSSYNVESTSGTGVGPPPPLSRPSRLEAIPGAYSVRGPGRPESHDANVIVSDENNDVGLAVANLVEEGAPADLPIAERASIGGTTDATSKQFKTAALTLMAVVLVIVAVIVGVVSVKPSSGGDDSATEEPTSVTPAPTTLEDKVLGLFPDKTVEAIISDPDSPQALAFKWTLEDDLLLYLSDERIVQRFALVTFYFATGGDTWADKTDWLEHGVNECNWYNAASFAMKDLLVNLYDGYLAGITEPKPRPCDLYGNYQHFWLDQNNLKGTVPEEIYLLTSLQTLSFRNAELQGTISSQIGKLANLEGFQMKPTGGSIPTEIGLLTKMRALLMFVSGLTGFIPTELWQLTKLQHIDMSNNPQLKGTIPSEIGNFHSMGWFLIQICSLSGSIPTEIGLMESLRWLALGRNSLTGPIPSELGKIEEMALLSIVENLHNGTLPSELGLMTQSSTSVFGFHGNQLSGQIPSELGLLTNVHVSFNLSDNVFSGTIPTELGLLAATMELRLSGNQLTGPIPTELGQLASVGQLSLANNSLSGTIPLELLALRPSLHSLYLEGNDMLSGIIPEGLCVPNGTCIGHILDECIAPFGLTFDCTSLLCGCGCSCTVG